MKKRGHGFNDINERLVGNEQKLVFTIQKIPQIVGVRAKQKVVNAREKKVLPQTYIPVETKKCQKKRKNSNQSSEQAIFKNAATQNITLNDNQCSSHSFVYNTK